MKCHKMQKMSTNIFEINNLECAYKKHGEKARAVLSVKELNIPSGKMIFIIGPSGIGKSTILETLGIMNNTLVVNPNSKFIYFQPNSAETYDIIEMWKRNKDKELSTFRRNNLSFIFQQTNLMRNFSAYQNVMITGMLQGQTDRESAIRTKEIFSEIKMPVFDMTRNSTKLSGGQQQKVAYARAILPSFNILFGDEPTGNLDFNNARLLISEMQKHIEKNKSTVIIVSHDLDVSVRFADIIIKIQALKDQQGEISKGIIDKTSLYSKEGNGLWRHLDKSYSDEELLDHLKKNILQIENEA